MKFDTAIARVAGRLNKNSSDTVVAARIGQYINDTCKRAWEAHKWSFRSMEYPLVLTAYATGSTLTATNGNNTVTASDTPFVSGHLGGFLRFTADTIDTQYKIINVVSSSQVTIEPAYQGTTGGTKSYELRVADYKLPTEAHEVEYVYVPEMDHKVYITAGFDPVRIEQGAPIYAQLGYSDVQGTSYTTGTVTASANAVTVTGSGSAWLANVNPGDILTITGDTNEYTVFRVVSDTSLVLYNKIETAASGATYTIESTQSRYIRFQPAPERAYTGRVQGWRSYAELIHDNDTNELLTRYPDEVIEGAVRRELGASPDQRESGWLQVEDELWRRARANDQSISSRFNRYPIWNARRR